MSKQKSTKRKILAFITDGESFLLLRNNPSDKKHGGDYWFTVTGEIEGNEDDLSAVSREVKEETNLNIREALFLNWGSTYMADQVVCEEYNYLVFVNKGDIELNEEHTDFRWADLDEFVSYIHWTTDKVVLKRVLEEGLRKKLYFGARFEPGF